MKLFAWRSWMSAIAVTASALLPVHAGVVTFEDAPTGIGAIFEDGQSFTSGGFLFTPTSLFLTAVPGDFVGAVDVSSGILLGAPPTNGLAASHLARHSLPIRPMSIERMPRLCDDTEVSQSGLSAKHTAQPRSALRS